MISILKFSMGHNSIKIIVGVMVVLLCISANNAL